MKEALVAACLLCWAAGLAAAAEPGKGSLAMRVREHPRVYFTRQDLPRLRASGFEAERYLGEKEMTIPYFGGKRVSFELPPKEPGHIEEPPGFDAKSYGHYPYWTGMAGNLRTRLQDLALAYAATGEPEYADAAIRYALSLSEWSIWTDVEYHPNKTTCLDTGYLTLGVAAAYDACYDRMTDAQRAKVRDGLVRLGLEPLYRDVIRPVSQESEFNLEILQNAALGVGALAVMGEIPEERSRAYVEQASSYFLRLLEKKLTSPNTEGLSYSGMLDLGFVYADALRRVTGDDALFRHPYAGEVIPKWVAYFLGPARSGCVNFCDCGGYPWPFLQTLKLVNNNTGNGLAGWYLRQARAAESGGFYETLYANADRKAVAPDDLPPSAEFRNIGWAALRSGWGERDTLLAFKCSSSKEGHDHNDAGNFVLNHAGVWLLTDPGYGSFRSKEEGFFGRSTPGHNTILVDGESQTARAGRITDFHTSPRLDYVVGDAAACYAGGKVKRFLRHVVQVRGGYFVVYDELESDGPPRKWEWLLHTDAEGEMRFGGKAVAEGATVVARALSVEKSRARVDATILEPAGAQSRFARYPGAESYPAFAWVSPAEPAASARYLVAFEASGEPGVGLANAGFEKGLSGWTVGGEPGHAVEVVADKDVFSSGTASVRLTGTVAKRDRALVGQWYLPCEEGKRYRFAIRHRTKDLAEGKPVADITFYDAQRKHVPTVTTIRGRAGTHDWEFMEATVVAPKGAALVTCRAGLDWGAGTVWFDDASWEEAGTAAPPAHVPVRFTRVQAGHPRAAALQAEGPGFRDLLILNPEKARLTVKGVTTDAAVAWVRFRDGAKPEMECLPPSPLPILQPHAGPGEGE